MASDMITWRGHVLKWRSESWPRFDNRDDKKRAFFASVMPDGRRWVGELRDAGDGAELNAKGKPQQTPELALDDALSALRRRLAASFPEGKKGRK